MTNPLVKIVNSQTNEEIVREMNEEELQLFEDRQIEANVKTQAALASESAKQSGIDKLSALGLTPEEIAAITGAN
jgi:Holliday junction resolvasome RuvABC DNA-binding subunit